MNSNHNPKNGQFSSGGGSVAKSVSVMQNGKMTTVESRGAPSGDGWRRVVKPGHEAAYAADNAAFAARATQAAKDAFASLASPASNRPSVAPHAGVQSVGTHDHEE